MKIAVPTAEGRLAMHFGHCEQFTILEVDPEGKKVIDEGSATPPPHEPGVLPRWLHEQGVNLVIAGGMGRRAQDLFTGNGVEVVVGAPAESPRVIVEQYLQGTLIAGDNVCDH